jgi:hypothetical protein
MDFHLLYQNEEEKIIEILKEILENLEQNREVFIHSSNETYFYLK